MQLIRYTSFHLDLLITANDVIYMFLQLYTQTYRSFLHGNKEYCTKIYRASNNIQMKYKDKILANISNIRT